MRCCRVRVQLSFGPLLSDAHVVASALFASHVVPERKPGLLVASQVDQEGKACLLLIYRSSRTDIAREQTSHVDQTRNSLLDLCLHPLYHSFFTYRSCTTQRA